MTQPHSSLDDSDSQDPSVHARQFLARLEAMTPPAGLTRGTSSLAIRAKRLWEELVEVAEQMVERESTARSDGERAARKESPTLRLRATEESNAPPSRPRFKRHGSMPSAASLLKSPPAAPSAPKKVADKTPVAKGPSPAPPVVEKTLPVEPAPSAPKIVAPPVQVELPVVPANVADAPTSDSSLPTPVALPTPVTPPKRVFAKKPASPPKPEQKEPVSSSPRIKTPAPSQPRARSSWQRQERAADPPQAKAERTFPAMSLPEPDRSEIGMAIHWWSAPVFLALSLMIAAVLGGFGAETLRVSSPQAELTRVLRRPDSTPDQVRQTARQLVSSPLTRYSANRDLLMAEATARVHDEASDDADSKFIKHLERASAKEPLSDWHRLNVAHATKGEVNRLEEVATVWKILAKSHSAEPLVQEQLAFHHVEMGDLADAVGQLKSMLEADPERTDRIVSQLLSRRVSLDDSLEVVPNSPIAWMKLYELSERETVIGLRQQVEVRLTQMDPGATNSEAASWKPTEWAALGALFQGFERWDDAADAWQKCVSGDPSRRDWKYSLARARFEQKRFDDCEDALAELLMSKLSPDMLSQVKALQDQVTSARAEEAMPGGGPLSPATLRAN